MDGNNSWIATALQLKAYEAAGTLSKTDDTNVTLTLGGTPAASLFNNVSITAGWTGTLAATRGGTGLGSLGSAKSILRVNAAGTAMEFSATQSIGTGLAVGTTSDPVASAVLDVVSTTKGFGLPAMTSAQKDAISSPREGLMVYDTDLDGHCMYDGVKWVRMAQRLAATVAVGAGAGTGASATISGTDLAGTVTLTGGTSASASATVFTITFGSAFSTAPGAIIIVPFSNNAAALGSRPVYGTAVSTTTATASVGSVNVISNGTVYVFAYHVIQ